MHPNEGEQADLVGWRTGRTHCRCCRALAAGQHSGHLDKLARRGFRNQYLYEVRPLRPDGRTRASSDGLGRSGTFQPETIRLAGLERDPRRNPQRVEIESIEPGDVLVIEARGETGAGVSGDMLAARVLARGGFGMVTDGAFRDTPGLGAPGEFAEAHGQQARLSPSSHVPITDEVPIPCTRTTELPVDKIVGDEEGAVVVPRQLVAEVALAAAERETLETFLLQRIRDGTPLLGSYLPDEATRRVVEPTRTRLKLTVRSEEPLQRVRRRVRSRRARPD